jgi:hypothetical protein
VLVFTPDGIKEQGSPNDLIKLGGLFSALAKLQATPPLQEKIPEKNMSRALDYPKSEVIGGGAEKEVDNEESPEINATKSHELPLISCLIIIAKAQRRHWLWMIGMFIPCFIGGKYIF